MGYALAMSACVGCGRVFGYSPTKVPSVLVDGSREPICESCVVRFNAIRAERGLPLIVPKPGAYEADDESEL